VFDNIRALFGKANQAHEPIDVNALAVAVLDALGEELKVHEITMRAELKAELPLVMGHSGQLQQVFINLLRNAIEAMAAFKDSRRLLQLRSSRGGDNAIVVEVEDCGPGIDPGRLANVFDAFITTKPHGMGLGLAICRMIVERHHGKLAVKPAQPNGSIFSVVLPGVPGAAS
jgi:signal transduction histidine kinase